MSSRQLDLFQDDEQADLFDEDAPTPVFRPTRTTCGRNSKILAEARAAQTMAWDAKGVLLYRTIFPQMTNWLPEEEGAQLRFEFEAELARLEATYCKPPITLGAQSTIRQLLYTIFSAR